MFLIDAIYVNNGGGRRLLEVLLRRLGHREDILFLLDSRLPDDVIPSRSKYIRISAGEWSRLLFYLRNKAAFSKVFCFGNIPPPIKLSCPVKTYLHNRHFLRRPNLRGALKKSFLLFLKRFYLSMVLCNSDSILVQTGTMRVDTISAFPSVDGRVDVVPFFDSGEFSELSNVVRKSRDVFGFVSLPHAHKGHRDLIKAWLQLVKLGYFPELHLTIPQGHPLEEDIRSAVSHGARIVNHGFCYPRVIYSTCFYQIYPSFIESFGLGLIEAVEAGCDIVAPDLPYVHDVVVPSVLWDCSGGVNEIANAVICAMTGDFERSKVSTSDQFKYIELFLS